MKQNTDISSEWNSIRYLRTSKTSGYLKVRYSPRNSIEILETDTNIQIENGKEIQ